MQVVNTKIVAKVTLVSFLYPDSKTGEMIQRKGRVEEFTSTGFKLFIGNEQYRSFKEENIRDLIIVGG
jgi:hypothetical protein